MSIHRYSYIMRPTSSHSGLKPISNTVGLDERIEDPRELELAIIDAVIRRENLNCSLDDYSASCTYLPEKDDE